MSEALRAYDVVQHLVEPGGHTTLPQLARGTEQMLTPLTSLRRQELSVATQQD